MNLAEAVDIRGSTKLLKLISGTHKQPVTSPMMMPSLVSARCTGVRWLAPAMTTKAAVTKTAMEASPPYARWVSWEEESPG
jgi:hypothetical protein